MFKSQIGMGKQLPLVFLLAMTLNLGVGNTQDETSVAKAVGLIHKAMDAYGNLEFDTCMSSLNEALGMAAQLDRRTLARVYEGYAVLWAGGYADNSKGTTNFLIAVCLDSGLEINPLFSTPEVDILFKLAREQATPERCSDVLNAVIMPADSQVGQSGMPGVAGQADIAPCGEHDPLTSQKQKYELPFYVSTKPETRSKLSRVVVRYAFDGGTVYKELPLPPRGSGFGALLTCDEGQIRIFDPATVTYYIEGQDAQGGAVCGHGSKDYPLEVLMLPDAAPLGSIAGLQSRECAPCPPWDENCGRVVPQEGELCSPDSGCAEGLVCGDDDLCAPEAGGAGGSGGPSKFYVNLLAGSGFGFLKKELTIKRVNTQKNPEGYSGAEGQFIGLIEEDTQETSGTAWSGIPLRLAVGFFVMPKLSIELSARFDVYVTSKVSPKSCWEVAGESITAVESADCASQVNVQGFGDDLDKKESVARTIPGNEESEAFQYAWLLNARLRYEIFRKNALAFNFFGGLGYGHFQYRVKPKTRSSTDEAAVDEEESETPFFPMTGVFDLEIGVSMTYFFTKHVGLIVEVPIDFVFGSGFSANADLAVGLGFGF